MDFDGSIEVPPNQELQHWTLKLPAKAGVYLLWGMAGEPILLATTGNVRAAVRRKLQANTDQTGKQRTQLDRITKGVSWTQANSNFVSYGQFHQLARQIYPGKYRQMLGWKDPWWVKICLSERIGTIRATKKISVPGTDEYMGPWPSIKAVRNFIDLATDMHGLCRSPEILRQMNSKKTCTYAQMGKCCGVCLEKMSTEEYRGLLEEVMGLAEREKRLEKQRQLKEQMKQAAENLEFEVAANIKTLIKRLDELKNKDARWVGSLRQFGFLVIAPGADRKHIQAWRVYGGSIQDGEVIELGRIETQIGSIVDWARQGVQQRPTGQAELQQWRESISMVSYFLFRAHSDQCLYYKLDNMPKSHDLAGQIKSKFKRDRIAPLKTSPKGQ
jgi:excinuclease UvrABC nuclease subunit